MSAAKRDRRRPDIAKILEAHRQLGVAESHPAPEQTLWVILARHGTKEGATRAVKALGRRFVDINDFRAAKPSEIAGLIRSHVRNDAMEVAQHSRAFLRRLFIDHFGVTFDFAQDFTADAIWKALVALPDSGQEIALGLLLYFCTMERQAQAEEEAAGKRRPDRELTASANRLRILFAFATLGVKTRRSRLTINPRAFLKHWSFSPLPGAEGAKPKRRKKAAKKTADKKTPAETARKTAKGARPKTTRTTRTRVAKKSSRR